MATLELARKLDLCLQAQVKLQKERDELLEALQMLEDVERHNGIPTDEHWRIVRAALAKATGDK